MLARKLINNINNFFNIKDEYFDYKNLTLRKRIKFPCKKLPECIINLLKDLKISSEQITTFKIEEISDKFTQSPHAHTPEAQTSIILPLKFTNNVFTITYKSFYYGKNKKGYKYRPNNKKYYKNEWLSKDHNKVKGLQKTDFPKKFFKTYLKNYDIENFKGLVVDNICKWKIGKPIEFLSNQLHSGSFYKNKKRWIVLHYKNLPINHH